MIIPKAAEKSIYERQLPFVVKALSKLGKEETMSN